MAFFRTRFDNPDSSFTADSSLDQKLFGVQLLRVVVEKLVWGGARANYTVYIYSN